MNIEEKLQAELETARKEAATSSQRLAEITKERDALRLGNELDRLIDERPDITIPRRHAKKLIEDAFALENGHLRSTRPGMNTEDALKAVIEEHPFMIASSISRDKTDSPKLENIFGRKSNAKLANKLANENPDVYRALRMQARDAGLI